MVMIVKAVSIYLFQFPETFLHLINILFVTKDRPLDFIASRVGLNILLSNHARYLIFTKTKSKECR